MVICSFKLTMIQYYFVYNSYIGLFSDMLNAHCHIYPPLPPKLDRNS